MAFQRWRSLCSTDSGMPLASRRAASSPSRPRPASTCRRPSRSSRRPSPSGRRARWSASATAYEMAFESSKAGTRAARIAGSRPDSRRWTSLQAPATSATSAAASRSSAGRCSPIGSPRSAVSNQPRARSTPNNGGTRSGATRATSSIRAASKDCEGAFSLNQAHPPATGTLRTTDQNRTRCSWMGPVTSACARIQVCASARQLPERHKVGRSRSAAASMGVSMPR